MSPKPEIGSITWCDLTVPNAEEVKTFYEKVIGWKADPVSMGDYDDYSMIAPESNKIAAGICNAKGINAKLPPQWLIYITVENVDTSAQTCLELGGRVLVEPKNNFELWKILCDTRSCRCCLCIV